MSVTRVALAVAFAVGVSPVAWADHAAPRGGGSGGGSSAGSHHSGGSSGHVSSSSAGSHSSASGGGGAHPSSSSSLTDAERRHPRAGTGRFYRYGNGYRYGGYGYYPGYFPSYWSFYYGYPFYSPYYGYYDYYGSPYYGYGYGAGYGYYPHRRYYSGEGSVRLMVDPDKTRVYVDGYYAGVVDDFDGLFQRLHVAPGRHEITLKLDGFRTHRMKVYVPYDDTLKIHYDMVRGDGEDVEDMIGPADRDDDRYDRRSARDDDDDAPMADHDRDRRPMPPPEHHNGELRLSVQPDDASIYVDGAFRGTARQLRMLRLEAGPHRVEVVRPGFKTWERDVDVKPGDSTNVDVTLDR